MKKKQSINQEISSLNVRLIDEKGSELGVVNIDQAMLLAYEKGLDLVEVGSNATPPVCKIIDYGKYLYEKEKQIQKQKSKQKGGETKEIQLGIYIDKHDLDCKVKRAKEFLDQNNRVMISIKLKGRENIFADKAHKLIDEFKNLSQAKFEQNIKRQGNRISAIIKK